MKEKICKCVKCMKIYKDPFPNNSMVMKGVPKKVLPIDEDVGCPTCLSWDYLEDVVDTAEIVATSLEEALSIAAVTHPDYIFVKTLGSRGTRHKKIDYKQGTGTVWYYLFVK